MDANAALQRLNSHTESEKFTYFSRMYWTNTISEEATYRIFRCESPVVSPIYPPVVFRKQYKVKNVDVEMEKRLLLLMGRMNLPNVQTTRYIYHHISGGFLYLYFDAFECVLSSRISQGRRKYEEMVLWHHFFTLSQTLSTLHQVNLYHRNLSPKAIFERGEELFIGNFDDGIELPNGVSVLQATRRDNLAFHSPQMVLVQEHPDMYTYGWAKKEDAWALGRVMLEFAILSTDHAEQLLGMFPSEHKSMEQSQTEVSQYVQSKLQGRYSHYLTEAILALLQVDHERRPNLQDFFHSILPRFYHETTCLQCGVPVRKVWPCPHILCDKCHFTYLREHEQANQMKHCTCPVNIDEALIRLLPEQSRFMACGIMHLKEPCENISCNVWHKLTNIKDEHIVPRYIQCDCGDSYCSFCHRRKKHTVLRLEVVCGKFSTNSKH